jgi:ribose transport system substrate-binding protein
VSKVLVTNSGQNVATQVAAIRDYISEGVNAILIDPASTVGYNQVIQEALSRGIKVVVTDQDINDSAPWQIETYQYAIGVKGMNWLAAQMHGHGNLVVVQGEIGSPGNTDRENGLLSVLKKYPNIHVVASVAGDWDDATAHTVLASALAAHPNVGGVWLSGGTPGAILAMGSHPTIPFVAEDDGTPYLKWMVKYAKTEHAAVFTNPPSIGAAGFNEAVGLLRGFTYSNKSIQLTPYLYSNQTADGLKYIEAHENLPLPASAPTGWSIPGYTHYTFGAMHSCLG